MTASYQDVRGRPHFRFSSEFLLRESFLRWLVFAKAHRTQDSPASPIIPVCATVFIMLNVAHDGVLPVQVAHTDDDDDDDDTRGLDGPHIVVPWKAYRGSPALPFLSVDGIVHHIFPWMNVARDCVLPGCVVCTLMTMKRGI